MPASKPFDAAPRPVGRAAWPWPLPALAAWIVAWGLCLMARPWVGEAVAFSLAAATGVALAAMTARRVRQLVVALGFPASALAMGLADTTPAWAWLLPLAVLGAVYPVGAWRDAPLFPTPAGALDDLAAQIPLKPGARVLDAGCGLGDGLLALRAAWPQARVEGIEWSWPLAAAAAMRCRFARVRRGDMWARSWAGHDLVYLFQRPESMARAWAKAQAELPAGAWMASLEFDMPGRRADRECRLAGGRLVRAWQVPPQSRAIGADNPP